MKNSSDTIGNKTCDLPACSALPPPTAPSRAHFLQYLTIKIGQQLDLNAFGCLSGTATMNEKLFCQASSVPRC